MDRGPIQAAAGPIPFSKLSGCGNDFIIIDNRTGLLEDAGGGEFAVRVCSRKMSVGADGLILIEPSQKGADFRWRFFNADGSPAGMCGNGARCAARFAHGAGIAGEEMTFETGAGLIRARIMGDRVNIQITEPSDLRTGMPLSLAGGTLTVHSIDTGVPHAVVSVPDVEGIDVVALGREIRHHPAFSPAGANVNFVSRLAGGDLVNRTYERGVEDETLACGTGSVAAALVLSLENGGRSPVRVRTRSGGWLTVHYRKADDRFTDVFLEGDARIVCRGELFEDAWRW